MIWKTLFGVVLVLGLTGTVVAEEEEYDYVGVKRCKICHMTDKKAGTHYKVWEEQAHAKAFEILGTEKAMESAKKHGIEDPQKDKRCLQCHTVKAEPGPDDKVTLEEGISCEACHGPASGYLKPHNKEGYEAAIELGMIPLREMEKEKIAETCTQCHREDPLNDFYKPFDYDEYFAKIDHSEATSPEIKAKREEGK